MNKKLVGTIFLTILSSSLILETLCYPQHHQGAALDRESYEAQQIRKFAEKPNNVKKVVLEDRNDLDDINTNQISDTGAPGGFSWGNILTMLMTLIFNPAGTTTTQVGPSKSDVIDTEAPQSPWANLLSVGLKILTAILSGTPMSDGIDKVDNPSPVPQIINILVNLLDALKTSFSHRSMRARSLGNKDSISEVGLTGTILTKAVIKSMKTSNNECLQKYICEANQECMYSLNNETQITNKHNLYCQLGNYLTSYLLRKKSSLTSLLEAGKRGRSLENCQEIYLMCNEV